MALATVRRVTAEPLPRANPATGIVRALAGDAATEALVLAAAVPFLFLHATYQPSASLGVGSTSVDVTLADAAIACVLVAAALRGRREGWDTLLRARVVLGLAAAFLLVCAASLATPSLLGEDYDLTRHAISLAKFGWYATLLPATVLLVRSTADLVPVVRAFVAWSVAATSWGLLQFLGIVAEFEGKRPGQREPSFVGIHDLAALSGRRSRRRLDRRRARRRSAGGETLVGRGARHGRARRRPLRRDDGRARPLARRSRRCFSAHAPSPRSAAAAHSRWSASRSSSRPGPRPCARTTIERFAEFIGLRERVADTGVESYAHRTLLAYIGGRIWLDRPGDRRRLAGLERGVGVRAVPRRRARPLPERARPGLPVAGAPVGDPDALPPGRRRPRDRGDRLPARARRRRRSPPRCAGSGSRRCRSSASAGSASSPACGRGSGSSPDCRSRH